MPYAAELETTGVPEPAERSPTVTFVRELRESDHVLLASGVNLVEAGAKARPTERIRDRHHAVARLIAQGLKFVEVSAITGMSAGHIGILARDPAFKALIHDYSKIENGLLADFTERATILSLTAMNELQERLETRPEEVSESMLLEVVKTTADRIGHAPVSKSVTLNASVDLSARMTAARQRLAQRQVLPSPSQDE